MVSIARRNLFAERGRLFISVGGVAFAVLLILTLLGLYRGFTRAFTLYIDNVKVDLWVAQQGARADMMHSVSLMPRGTQGKLEAVPGVEEVHPFIGRSVVFPWKGEAVSTYLVGYDVDSNLGGPLRVAQGKAEPGPGEIIVDKVFSRNKGISLGDRLPIGGSLRADSSPPLQVVGVAEGGNTGLFQFSFVSRNEAESLLQMTGFANYFLVHLDRGQDPAQAAARIEAAAPGVKAFTVSAFSESNRELLTEIFLPIIAVLVLIGFGVGTVVIGLTIYTATMEKSREYGVLKAIGATNRRLYRIVLEQAIISDMLGYALGVVLAFVVVGAAERFVPVFVADLQVLDLAAALGIALLMGGLASYFPVSRLVRLDPALVFRA
ncbi:MAG: ABC transporter permease [Chloroflexi bacterium]|nr:ABC transporter permease [Chloroflexota bacterium]